MSDSQLRGKVVWLLMTARIHLLSADIRRPGRVGDLIIPVLDPEGDDRREFLLWVLEATGLPAEERIVEQLDALTAGYSAAAFASLRSQLKPSFAVGLSRGHFVFRAAASINATSSSACPYRVSSILPSACPSNLLTACESVPLVIFQCA